MASIDDLFQTIKKLNDEVRKLRGRIDSISIGGTIIVPPSGTAPVPTAVDGALIVGNSTPAWERKVHPTPGAGEEYDLTFNDGDTQPQWRLKSAAASAFTDLTDVPATYAGAGGYKVKVKGDESGLEFLPDAGTGQYRQFVYEVSGGDFTFIVDGSGNPIFALEDLE